MQEASIVLGLVVALLLGIIPFVYVSIRQQGQARLLQPAPKETHASPHRLASLHNPWASHFRFEWIGGYRFRGLDRRFVAAWRHAEQPVFLMMQLVKGAMHYELLSVFNREQTLTTTSLCAIVPPTPPNGYVQRFPDASLTELFRQHVAAHDFLVSGGHVKLEPHAARFDRVLIEVLARTHAFVTSLPAWPLRSVSWVLLGPRRARNRSVPEQLGFQTIPDPNAEKAALEEALASPTKARSAAAQDHAGDDPQAPHDDQTAAEVEALVAKTGPRRRATAARAGAGAGAGGTSAASPARASAVAAPSKASAARPAPKAERTR